MPSGERLSGEASPAEPWLRGTGKELPAVPRAVLHALQLAEEDLGKWCGGLTDADLNARPREVAPVAFHLRHIARSLDRLLTYAEGANPDAKLAGKLSDRQFAQLKSELDAGATHAELFGELDAALKDAASRVRALADANLEEIRSVGTKHLPSTVGGLLVHVADHTQRHVGQAITTAKILGATPQNSHDPR
jgi:uncharacterized damage-inducible protein DinB